MNKIYDIRDQMPKFAANFFPPYEREGKDYPKMMLNPETKKPYLDKAKNIIIVASPEEEDAFLASKQTSVPPVVAPKTIEIAAVEEPTKRGPGRPPMPKTLTA